MPKPQDIPSNPHLTYKNQGWKGYGDWLGTGTIAPRLREYRPFEDARKFAHSLNLRNRHEWKTFCNGEMEEKGTLPEDIPSNANTTYKNKGWSGWGDWVGTGTVAPFLREYRSFEKARSFVHGLGLKNSKEWKKYINWQLPEKGLLPDDIPRAPWQVYSDKGWTNIGDWLGTGNVAVFLREYRPFEKAREFARGLGLKSGPGWTKFCKGELPEKGHLPNDIPANPSRTYKNEGWAGMGDWLGTGTIAPYLRQYRPFDETRQFVRGLGLRSESEWRKYCKSELFEKGVLPKDIPAGANSVYKDKGWKGWGDFLGTGAVATYHKKYQSFKKARAFVHRLNLKDINEWRKYCKSGKKPEDIPSKPERVYKGKGWEGTGDWFGTGYVHPKFRQYLSFEEAREFIHKLHLKSTKEWGEYCKSDRKPEFIPASPARKYKDEGWINYGDWLGTGEVASYLREYLPFEQARKIVRKLGLKKEEDWRLYCKNKKKPENIPAYPAGVYKNDGWKGYGNWLGTGRVQTQQRAYLSFEKAREFIHRLNLKNQNEWRKYCSSDRNPENIPAAPHKVYKNAGWKGYGNWLGTGYVPPRLIGFLPFKEAREFVHKLDLNSVAEWRQYIKSEKKPSNIPAAPDHKYKNDGWKGYPDWLGKG